MGGFAFSYLIRKLSVQAKEDWDFKTETGVADFKMQEVYILRMETE